MLEMLIYSFKRNKKDLAVSGKNMFTLTAVLSENVRLTKLLFASIYLPIYTRMMVFDS